MIKHAIRLKRQRVITREEELYPIVMAKLLKERGKVLPQHKVGSVIPDFVIDRALSRSIVEVKLFDSEQHLPQLVTYSKEADEVCVALPTAIRGFWECYIPIYGYRVVYGGYGRDRGYNKGAAKRVREEAEVEEEETEET